MQQLRLADIRIDGGTQPREAIDNNLVKEYSEAMKEGDKFPPMGVVFDGAEYWLYDGFHRYHAAHLAGAIEFPGEVINGSQETARWLSLTTNKNHGLRRTNADKQKAVKIALEMRPDMSDRALAQHCGVSNTFVSKTRKQVSTVDTSTKKREGLDGKSYPVMPTSEPNNEPKETTPPPESKREVDKIGRYIPDECLEVWSRRSEIQAHLTALSKLRVAITKGFESKDPLYKGANAQSLQIELNKAYGTMKTLMPYTVCPYCQGFGDCHVCEDKGMISQFRWDTAIPSETKADIQDLIEEQE